MKRRLLMVLVTVMVPFLCATATRAKSPSAPHVAFGEQEFDFGEVDQGAVVEHTFQVFNQGDQVLGIVKVKPG